MSEHDRQTALVVTAVHRGHIRPASLELLTIAHQLDYRPTVWHRGDLTTEHVATYRRFGVADIYTVASDETDLQLSVHAASVAKDLVEHTDAELVLFTSNFENKEVSALLAQRLDAGVVVDAMHVERPAAAESAETGGVIVAQQTVFAGSWTVRTQINTRPAILAVKANSIDISTPATSGAGNIHHWQWQKGAHTNVRMVSRTPYPTSDRPSLAEAARVVAGGRGTQGDFSQVRELAEVLDAAVGATRDVTDAGWIGHEAMIGQTGVTIAPSLYIGAGVSGAIHHRGGMQGAKTIVAINTDPEAPIFQFSDAVIIGDLAKILPQASARIAEHRRATAQVSADAQKTTED